MVSKVSVVGVVTVGLYVELVDDVIAAGLLRLMTSTSIQLKDLPTSSSLSSTIHTCDMISRHYQPCCCSENAIFRRNR